MTAHRRRAGQGASLVPDVMCRPWRGRIYVGGKAIHLGYFATAEEARAAHAAAVKERLGEQFLKAPELGELSFKATSYLDERESRP
jgi:hypothetical protein